MNSAIHPSIFVVLTTISFSLLSPAFSQGDEMRAWTDATGREIRASIDGFEDEKTVIFKLENGRTVPYQIAGLSVADQAVARRAFQNKAKPTTTAEIDWENPKQSEKYVIKSARRQNAPGFVSTKSGWEWQIKCVEATVEYKGEETSADGSVKAYFYNRDNDLIDVFRGPPRRQDENGVYTNAPKNFEQGEAVETYFPLTEFLEESDWSTALIVFGSGSEISVDTMPRTNLKDLDFPEKRFLFPAWKGGGSEEEEEEMTSNVDLEIRRVRQQTYRDSLIFNGDYQKNMPCVSAEVRVLGDFTPGDGKVKMHVFDESQKLVFTRRRTSSAQIDGSGTYVDEPRIADEDWYPIFFALDRELAGKDYPTYVVVFEFGGKTTAAVESSTNATLESLDFPEKEELTDSE